MTALVYDRCQQCRRWSSLEAPEFRVCRFCAVRVAILRALRRQGARLVADRNQLLEMADEITDAAAELMRALRDERQEAARLRSEVESLRRWRRKLIRLVRETRACATGK